MNQIETVVSGAKFWAGCLGVDSIGSVLFLNKTLEGNQMVVIPSFISHSVLIQKIEEKFGKSVLLPESFDFKRIAYECTIKPYVLECAICSEPDGSDVLVGDIVKIRNGVSTGNMNLLEYLSFVLQFESLSGIAKYPDLNSETILDTKTKRNINLRASFQNDGSLIISTQNMCEKSGFRKVRRPKSVFVYRN